MNYDSEWQKLFLIPGFALDHTQKRSGSLLGWTAVNFRAGSHPPKRIKTIQGKQPAGFTTCLFNWEAVLCSLWWDTNCVFFLDKTQGAACKKYLFWFSYLASLHASTKLESNLCEMRLVCILIGHLLCLPADENYLHFLCFNGDSRRRKMLSPLEDEFLLLCCEKSSQCLWSQ